MTAGLVAAEIFPGKPTQWWLLRCLTCHVQAHYQFGHIISVLTEGMATRPHCQACGWRLWAAEGRARGGGRGLITTAELDDAFTRGGWTIVDLLQEPPTWDDPVLARCDTCTKLRALRPGEAHFGCGCSRGTVRQSAPRHTPPPAPGAGGTATSENGGVSIGAATGRRSRAALLVHSGSRALDLWDHEANDEVSLRTATVRATRYAQWRCPACGHAFRERVRAMVDLPACPACRERDGQEWAVVYEQLSRTAVAGVAQLVEAWAEDIDPRTIAVTDIYPRRFRCSDGHHPRVTPYRFLNAGCPLCRGQETRKANRAAVDRDLAHDAPELAEQWHLTRNATRTPSDILATSRRAVWWRSTCCGHEWQASPAQRDWGARLRCPACKSILGSLAWQDPAMAAEWHPDNPVTAWHIRPSAAAQPWTPRWVCAKDTSHQWQMGLPSRASGGGCPECRESGKSRVELAYHAAAVARFGSARSGAVARHDTFATRSAWTIDVLVQLPDGPVALEYDGAYWHREDAKRLIDERKTTDLLRAGYRVVRLRADNLSLLEIEHPSLLQLRVHEVGDEPSRVLVEVAAWLAGGADPARRGEPPASHA